MTRNWWIALLCAFSMGCVDGGGGDDDDDDDDDLDFPDIDQGLIDQTEDNGECDENPVDPEVPTTGAISYFIGDFRFNADKSEMMGYELWILHNNPYWQSLDEDVPDICQIVWWVTGTTDEPISCLTCDYSLELDAQMDKSLSDCSQEFVDYQYNDVGSFSVVYDVNTSSGDSTFQWTGGANAGDIFGSGTGSDDAVNYVTDYSCFWF